MNNSIETSQSYTGISLLMPEVVPEPGFYYHYKHDPSGPVSNYAYEVLGVGFHTEDDARPGEEHFVVYRPLYPSSIYKAAQALDMPCFGARPLTMWMGAVGEPPKVKLRFTRITDAAVIDQLGKIRAKMYG